MAWFVPGSATASSCAGSVSCRHTHCALNKALSFSSDFWCAMNTLINPHKLSPSSMKLPTCRRGKWEQVTYPWAYAEGLTSTPLVSDWTLMASSCTSVQWFNGNTNNSECLKRGLLHLFLNQLLLSTVGCRAYGLDAPCA